MYYVIPRLTNFGWRSSSLISYHYYASLYGILLTISLMAFGGILQGAKMENEDPLVTIDTSNATTLSYYISGTMCMSIISIGNGVFILHLGWLLVDWFRTLIRRNPTIAELTLEPFEPEDVMDLAPAAAPTPILTEARR
jgi:cbb3-type cytochrome oxidase subunit 1